VKQYALLLCFGVFGSNAQTPTITGIVSSAIPDLNWATFGNALDPSQVVLPPRSLATIFGSQLATTTTLASSVPLPTQLGSVQLQIETGDCVAGGEDGTCNIPLYLLYVSPTQINFVTPDFALQYPANFLLIEDGVSYGSLGALNTLWVQYTGGCNDEAETCSFQPWLFEVGFDCLFSTSGEDSRTCGFSPLRQSSSQVLIGAITDESGNLATSSNPLHQGELVTFWGTGIPAAPTAQQTITIPLSIGSSQYTINPQWAGESPQFIGLDQVNFVFPTCAGQPAATAEHRYDGEWSFRNVTVHLPVIVRPGDPDCQWASPEN
jgi:hypothetical protein